jgi:hypothetical protein
MCVAGVAGISLLVGCSNTGSGNQTSTSSSAESSAESSAATTTVDPAATASHACSTFTSAADVADSAEIEWIKSVKNNAPPSDQQPLMQSMHQAVTDAVNQVNTALTPDVPDPPAGALRAWLNEETLLINPDPSTDVVDVMSKASQLEDPAKDACKPFS